MTSGELVEGQRNRSWIRRLWEVLSPWRNAAALRQVRAEAQKLRASNTELRRFEEQLLNQNTVVLKSLTATRKQHTVVLESLAKMRKQHTVVLKALAATCKQLAAVENDLDAQKARLRLVAKAMTPTMVNTERLSRFNSVLGEKLLPFLGTIDLLGNAADLVARLRAVQDRLRVMESLEDVAGKNIVAVAGGFSSGKSSFVSSLFDRDGLRLPIGIQPMTAIPTYIFHGNREFIRAYSTRSGTVAMDEATYGGLCHDQIERFGFNLRDLLPFVAIETSISRYPNLAFIDLPGHDPGRRAGQTGEDESTASEFLSQARNVLWLIGLDASGTLNRSSIDYLLEHARDDAELYVVLNKSDLRAKNAIEEILDEVRDQLMVAGLPFVGLSAYSSELQREIAWREAKLHDTLARWDEPVQPLSSLRAELEAVFDCYESALRRDIEDRKKKTRILKSLEVDLVVAGTFEEEGRTGAFDPAEFIRQKRRRSKSEGHEEYDEKRDGLENRLGKKAELVSQIQKANETPDNDRDALLESIRQHLDDLRKAHAIKEREEQLDTLIRLRSQLLNSLR